MLTSPPVVQTQPPAPLPKPKPRLDAAANKALAAAFSRVYLLSANINQYKTANQVQKKLSGHATFTVVKEYMGGGLNRSRTVLSYWSDLDKPRAEALAEIVRSAGVASAYAEISGDGMMPQASCRLTLPETPRSKEAGSATEERPHQLQRSR